MHGCSVQNIEHMQVRTGRRIPNFTASPDTVATNDAGAIGYFGNRYLLDRMSLISPCRSFHENLEPFRPGLLVIFDEWFPERQACPLFTHEDQLLDRVSLARNVICYDREISLCAVPTAMRNRCAAGTVSWKEVGRAVGPVSEAGPA